MRQGCLGEEFHMEGLASAKALRWAVRAGAGAGRRPWVRRGSGGPAPGGEPGRPLRGQGHGPGSGAGWDHRGAREAGGGMGACLVDSHGCHHHARPAWHWPNHDPFMTKWTDRTHVREFLASPPPRPSQAPGRRLGGPSLFLQPVRHVACADITNARTVTRTQGDADAECSCSGPGA